MILQGNVLVSVERGLSPVRAESFYARPLELSTLTDAGGQFSSEERAPEGEDKSLDETAKDEREYVRRRLREALGREPSEEEVDEWLRQHTEGY